MNLFSFLYSVLNWSYLLLQKLLPLFTIIINNLILYQKFLNEKRRIIYIFGVVIVYYNFIALPFIWTAFFYFKISLSISISKVFLTWSNTSLLADLFSANFSKEITKFFSGWTRTSAHNSSSFSVHRRVFFL